jgi:hypothetical protein
LVILLFDPNHCRNRDPNFWQHGRCTADAIRKPLEQNGLIRDVMLRCQQNDEGSANAKPGYRWLWVRGVGGSRPLKIGSASAVATWTRSTSTALELYEKAFMYGSSRRLLMHEYVQKLTSTTFPRSDLLRNGAELSQSTAPSKSGIGPSSPAPDAIVTSSGAAIAIAALDKNRRRLDLCGVIVLTPSLCESASRRIAREDQVAISDGLVAGKAGFEHRLVVGFAVIELSESPAAGRGVFLGVFDHELNVRGGARNEGLGSAFQDSS